MSEIHGPGEPVEFQFTQRATVMQGAYVREDRIARQEIEAGEQASGLSFWRVDGDGWKWYRRGGAGLPVIHGTPTTHEFIEADDADDGECECEMIEADE